MIETIFKNALRRNIKKRKMKTKNKRERIEKIKKKMSIYYFWVKRSTIERNGFL